MSALNVQNHSDPAVDGFAITPSDSTPIDCRAIYVGGAGNLTLRFGNSTTNVVITGVLAGQVYWIRPTRVMAATTATNLVGLN